jgi:transketolase
LLTDAFMSISSRPSHLSAVPQDCVDTHDLARRIRAQALRMVARSKASHIGSALSITDIVAVLYGGALDVFPDRPKDPLRDRFILSKGHACVAIYAALAETGFFPRAALESYATDGSQLMTHISHHIPGVEFSTGALGQGLPFGVGKALAAKRSGKDWRTVVLMSDGEMGEGSNWEAFMFAAHHKLDRLTAIIDYNKLQSLGTVADTLALEPLADKLTAFGWAVREIDGHDHEALSANLEAGLWRADTPQMLIAHTIKGKGVSYMENKVEWHYRSPDPAQLAEALAALGENSDA